MSCHVDKCYSVVPHFILTHDCNRTQMIARSSPKRTKMHGQSILYGSFPVKLFLVRT